MSASISMIGVLRDGSLWVGYKYGGLSVMHDRRLRHYRLEDLGTPAGSITGAAEDGLGNLWVATGRGIHYLDIEGRWNTPAPSWGIPDGRFSAVMLDSRGVLWLRGFMGVFALPRGAARFERKLTLSGFGKLAQHPDGSVWTTDSQAPGMFMLAPPDRGVPLRWNYRGTGNGLAFDRDGFAWTSRAPGVARFGSVHSSLTLQRTTAENGLSGSEAEPLFEDREGNMWVGTNNGLDQFKPPRLRALPLPAYVHGGGGPLVGGKGSSAWVDRSFVADPTAKPKPVGPPWRQTDETTTMFRAPDGTVWIGGNGGQLWVVTARGRERIGPPPGVHPIAVYCLGQGPDGAMWVSMGRFGLYTWRAGRWTPGGGIPALAALPATAIAADRGGRVWFGSVNDQIAILAGQRVRRLGHRDGLGVGTVTQVLPTADGAVVGGENGIAYFDGRRFTPVLGRANEPFAGITGMTFAHDGALWVNGSGGISSIAASELEQARREPGHLVHFRRLDYRDGLKGSPNPIMPVPSIGRSDDGTLWFSTTGGVFAFDPAKLTGNTLAPPVVITALKSGARSFGSASGAHLPAGTHILEVSFTALSYRVSERMEFRYRLEGVDRDWRDSEGQRSAHYTNLGPGHYVFHVIASNEDGVWNTTGASASFDIAPSLTETTWFRFLCIFAAIVAVWRLHLLRMRWQARILASRTGERLAERERIARELHDTLLQSVHGLILTVWSGIRKLPPEMRAPLEAAIDDAEEVLSEARDRVAGLRTVAVPNGDVARALSCLGESLAHDHAAAFSLTVDGDAWTLEAPVTDEVFAIAREALRNAFTHAHARTVSLSLVFTPTGMTVTVADDGMGLPQDVVKDNGRERHWGIPGMYERAKALGATLTLASRPRAGTTWSLYVPAGVALD